MAKRARKAERFKTKLVAGHKGVVVVIVPFDPEQAFGEKPVRLAGRRHGWLVEGTVNGAPFEGYVGERWGRFFISLEADLRDAVGLEVGEEVTCIVRPTDSAAVLAKSVEQSRETTQPSKARADARAV